MVVCLFLFLSLFRQISSGSRQICPGEVVGIRRRLATTIPCFQNDSSHLDSVDEKEFFTLYNFCCSYFCLDKKLLSSIGQNFATQKSLGVINLQHHALTEYRARGQKMRIMESQSVLPAVLVATCWE